jgi:hypothetical protein
MAFPGEPRGERVVVGFVDRASPLGAAYLIRKNESVFYRAPGFFTVPETVVSLTRAGFGGIEFRQILLGPLEHTRADDQVKPGPGECSFVAMRGIRV